eukprot:Skav218252  [mRNA]  locus=scaffold2035:19644:21998:+ [translate_table: standard]
MQHNGAMVSRGMAVLGAGAQCTREAHLRDNSVINEGPKKADRSRSSQYRYHNKNRRGGEKNAEHPCKRREEEKEEEEEEGEEEGEEEEEEERERRRCLQEAPQEEAEEAVRSYKTRSLRMAMRWFPMETRMLPN